MVSFCPLHTCIQCAVITFITFIQSTIACPFHSPHIAFLLKYSHNMGGEEGKGRREKLECIYIMYEIEKQIKIIKYRSDKCMWIYCIYKKKHMPFAFVGWFISFNLGTPSSIYCPAVLWFILWLVAVLCEDLPYFLYLLITCCLPWITTWCSYVPQVCMEIFYCIHTSLDCILWLLF